MASARSSVSPESVLDPGISAGDEGDLSTRVIVNAVAEAYDLCFRQEIDVPCCVVVHVFAD
jgi:hypothetical protein